MFVIFLNLNFYKKPLLVTEKIFFYLFLCLYRHTCIFFNQFCHSLKITQSVWKKRHFAYTWQKYKQKTNISVTRRHSCISSNFSFSVTISATSMPSWNRVYSYKKSSCFPGSTVDIKIFQNWINESFIGAPQMNEKIKLFGCSVKEIQNFNLLILMQIENSIN